MNFFNARMKKTQNMYNQTINASHLCNVNSVVLFRNLSQFVLFFYFALFLKENPTFSRHLRKKPKKIKKVLLIVKKRNQTDSILK